MMNSKNSNPFAELRYKERSGTLPKVAKPKAKDCIYKLVFVPDGKILTTNAPWKVCDTIRATYLRMAHRYSREQFLIIKV